MKKIVLTMVALLSMTASFAEGANKVNKANAIDAAENAKYEINVDVNSLGRALDLTYDEHDAVEYIISTFSNDMKKAGAASGEDRDRLCKQAVNRNLSYMHGVLDNSQYHQYVKLLNATLNNRGLNK